MSTRTIVKQVLAQSDRVVTFDDGTDDFCDHAVPALVEYEVPTTLYAATHFIDSGETFPWGAPAHFAYPKALPGSDAAEAEVRSRFTTAALARSRVNEPGATDLHRLWRTPIQRSDGFDFFAAKAAGGLRLEGELRDLVAKVKYRGTTR